MVEAQHFRGHSFSGLRTAFNDYYAEGGLRHISDVTCTRCSFDNCSIPSAYKLEQRVTVERVGIENCTAAACFIQGAIFSDVTVNRLETRSRVGFFCWGSFFRHVVLSGKLGFLKFNAECHADYYRMPKQQAIWNEAYQSFYKTVDWALDIANAEFTVGLDFHFVPGRLVRRNPATQVLVTREKLMATNWRAFDWGKSSLPVAIDWFLERSLYADCVFAAPTRSRLFERELFSIDLLRKTGLAEKD
jgi:hypothetical protein